MKVSGFTFLRNGQMLGYPFVESIRSILPIVDEFVIALGPCEDNTQEMVEAIGDSKIRIIHTKWNEKMVDRGYVYAQQKMIAQFNCSGDWAFYLETDEVVHENDLPKIKSAMENYLNDDEVEALAFDYLHFYGNANSYLWSPRWYRKEARIIKNTIRSYSADGLHWCVLAKNKVGRYPKGAMTGARIYHYGWVRKEEQMNLKNQKIQRYWNKPAPKINYSHIDSSIIHQFEGDHPAVIKSWLPNSKGIFKADPNHILTRRERKHRWMLKLERLFGLDLSKKHFKLVR